MCLFTDVLSDRKPPIDLLSGATVPATLSSTSISDIKPDVKPDIKPPVKIEQETPTEQFSVEETAAIEKELLLVLDDVSLNLPVELDVLMDELCKVRGSSRDVSADLVENLLQKFAAQMMVRCVSLRVVNV